jgi:hypothetical protein
MSEKQQSDLDEIYKRYTAYVVNYGLQEDVTEFMNNPSPSKRSCIRLYMDKEDLHEEMMNTAHRIKFYMVY